MILREDARVPPGHVAEVGDWASRLRERAGLATLRRVARVRVLSPAETAMALPRLVSFLQAVYLQPVKTGFQGDCLDILCVVENLRRFVPGGWSSRELVGSSRDGGGGGGIVVEAPSAG